MESISIPIIINGFTKTTGFFLNLRLIYIERQKVLGPANATLPAQRVAMADCASGNASA